MNTEAAKKDLGEIRNEVRSLPVEQWPPADKTAWAVACRPSVRLRAGGAASHLKTVTQDILAQRYGLFLDFVSRSKRLDQAAVAGGHVTPELVEPYVEQLKERVSSVTVYGSIQKLRRIIQLIAAKRDFGWLIDIERELFSLMRPRSKWDRVVLAEIIIEAGLTLIAQAEIAEKLPRLTRARMVRNGLMLALLAHYPIRLKNFAALEIGRSLVKVDKVWWIILSASETKEKRADERPIEDYIGEAIDKYLQTYRPILARDKSACYALWLAMNGEAMAQCSVGEVVTETTRVTLGVAINPHMFRTAGATTSAVHAGDQPHLGSALLHHTHPTVTQEHYNRARSISAGKAYAEVTRRYRAGEG